MPNWCLSSYVVTGDEKEVCDLYEKMHSLEEREESLVKNDFGKTWLGNLVTLLGGDWKTIYCRGEWYELEKDDDNSALRFDAWSAWSDPDEVIDFLQKHYTNLEFYFIAEEPGNNYFVTNDAEGEYIPERYSVLGYDSCEEFFYELGEEREFMNVVSELVGHKINTMEEVMSAVSDYNESHQNKEITVHIFKVIQKHNGQQEQQNQ